MLLTKTFSDIVAADAPLARMTLFGIGGIARQLIQPRSAEEMSEVIAFLHETGEPFRMLGGGTNLLVKSNEIAEPILHLGRMRSMRIDGECVYVEAGMPLGRCVTACGEAGLAGLEALAGVPGTVGGAAVMNAGGRHGNFGGMVKAVTLADGAQVRTIPAEAISFGYRTSSLRGVAVAAVTLALKRESQEKIAERRVAILAEKRRGQPLGARSAGCVFKNPPGAQAGRLIDEAGLKGERIGGALVSPLHANFIVNAGGATADDVLRLIEMVRKKINEKFNLSLELEIEIW